MRKKLQVKSIFVKVLSLIIPLVFIPLTISGVFHLGIMKELAIKYASLSLETTARETAGRIDNHFEDAGTLLRNIALIMSREKNLVKIEDIIKGALLENDIFGYIFVTDINGMEIANTNVDMSKRTHENEEHLSKALQGKEASSEIMFSAENFPFIVMCVSVKRWGTVDGALCAEIDCRILWDLMEGVEAGSTGYAYIVSGRGGLISYPESRAVLERKDVSRLEPVREVIAGKQGTMIYVSDEKRIASFSPIKSKGWGIIVEQPVKEALSPFFLARRYSLYFVVLLILATVVIAYYFSFSLTKPIRSLAKATEIVASGDLDYRVSMKRDDELGKLAESFNEMTLRIKKIQNTLVQSEKLATIGQLSAGLAHEIKNPLSGIYGYAQVLEEKLRDNATLSEYIGEMKEEIERVNRIVSRLLDFSSQSKPVFEDVYIRQVVEKCIRLSRHHLWHFRKIKIESGIKNILPTVTADASQLHQVFLNLILNASDASEDNSTINISAVAGNGWVSVDFQDNGDGISEEDMEHIFEPFFSKTRESKGTGLGLYISQNIIKAHDGEITVKSEKGKGTTVTVSLPCKAREV